MPAIISPENAAALGPIAEAGMGWVTELQWSPNGKALAVAASVGVALYGLGEI
jgi:hypothetical protein